MVKVVVHVEHVTVTRSYIASVVLCSVSAPLVWSSAPLAYSGGVHAAARLGE